ncbi:MAG: nitrous oxide reductase family maturation protein NosD [Epsilonproteobacteria bacterium]|nr:MAG: nitrous oxide reductase family maturation protein NosD [Campylobacterota bacterium]RLA68114.1 MAG: nitrous oxide reductase family maturation protein NosD [Campylobacterota bacterium]
MKPFLILILLGFSFQASCKTLQKLIDSTAIGGTLLLSGVYKERVVVNKSITIDGQNKTTIDGLGKNSVISITADNVTIKNLKITNSGNSHDQIDSAIFVTSSYNKITHNVIYNTLFGINFKEAHHNRVTHNDISSKKHTLGMRGDGIKVWASNNNLFESNVIHDSRDMVLWYSDNNTVLNNTGWNNRYSLHFMYAGNNLVRGNKYKNSAVGIFLMYSHHTVLESNELSFSTGGTGMGIGVKEVDHMTIKNNKIVYNSTGIYLDQSPYKPDAYNLIVGNTIAFNKSGVVIHSTIKNNVFRGNAFLDNLEDVIVHSNGTANDNFWSGNFWSAYEGLDRNRDGYGDRPFINKRYIDQIWINDKWGKFFFGSPVLSLLNLLAKIAPLSEPILILKDEKPIFSKNSTLRLSIENITLRRSDIEIDEEIEEEDAEGI